MKKSLLPFFLTAAAIFIFDQATKYYIKANIGFHESVRVLPFFDIVYTENSGSAFGMFREFGSLFFIIISLAAVLFLTALIIKDRTNAFPYSLLLGGAAGNLLDRMLYGRVTDFLDFYVGTHHWPAFNVADSALTIGIVLLMIRTVMGAKKK